MKLYKYLNVGDINTKIFATVKKSLKQNYKIYDKISMYSANLELLSYNTKNKKFNNKYSLFKLLKKKYRLGYKGFVYKAIVFHNRKKHYREIFMKELPIFPPQYNYNLNKYKTHNYNEYKYNFYKYNHHSSSNIEVFLSYICSKLYELRVSPNFCLFYDCYSVVLKKFSYELDKISHNIKSTNCKIFESSDEIILEKKLCPVILLALEKLDFDLDTINLENEIDLDFFKSIFFQIYSSIYIMYTVAGVQHNDLHIGNIMLKVTDINFLYYKINTIIYKIPTFGYIVKIIDWGRGTYDYNTFIGNNNIFNKNNDCENQIIFNRINKKPLVSKNNWVDIVTITQNILYNFPKIKLFKEFYTFLKKNIKMDNGLYLTTKSFNWEIYEHIARNDFNINPLEILQNNEFKLFQSNEKITKNEIIYPII